MKNSNWGHNDIGDQTGKLFIITGANSGLGKETARILAKKNASIVMAVRTISKGEAAALEIKNKFPNTNIIVEKLDLSDLKSIEKFCTKMKNDYSQLNGLINNAGVMMCPYTLTTDGFEMQMGTNHLGHFALTAQLYPLLKACNGARIVVLSSIAHIGGNINFGDLNWKTRKYNRNNAYADSKIANLYFAYEFARKTVDIIGAPIITIAHPGWTSTGIQRHSKLIGLLNHVFAQNVQIGSLPSLRAASDIDVNSGDFFGPSKFFKMHGAPVKVMSNKKSYNTAIASNLWLTSERLTSTEFDFSQSN